MPGPSTKGGKGGKGNKPKLNPEQIAAREERRRERERRRKERAQAQKKKERERNHLRPLTNKQLRGQAAAAAAAAYKPTLESIKAERARNDEIAAKRRADTQYFQQWLDRRLEQYDQAANQTNAAMDAAVGQSIRDTQTQYDQMRADLLARANERGGTDLSGYTGFNTDRANEQASDQLDLSRQQLARLAVLGAGMRTALSQNAASHLGALAGKEEEAWRSADTDLRDARAKALAERGALQSETFLKLKNIELDKAEMRFDRKMSRAEIRLKKAALRLDKARLNAEVQMNAADNATDIQVANINASDNDGGGSSGDPVDLRARKKNSREMNRTLISASQVIRSKGNLRDAWNRQNLTKIRGVLSKAGFPDYLYPALFSMLRTGKLSNTARAQIKSAGGIPGMIGGVDKLPRKSRGDYGR